MAGSYAYYDTFSYQYYDSWLYDMYSLPQSFTAVVADDGVINEFLQAKFDYASGLFVSLSSFIIDPSLVIYPSAVEITSPPSYLTDSETHQSKPVILFESTESLNCFLPLLFLVCMWMSICACVGCRRPLRDRAYTCGAPTAVVVQPLEAMTRVEPSMPKTRKGTEHK